MSTTFLILLIVCGFCLMMTVLQTILNKRVFMAYPLIALGAAIAAVLNR